MDIDKQMSLQKALDHGITIGLYSKDKEKRELVVYEMQNIKPRDPHWSNVILVEHDLFKKPSAADEFLEIEAKYRDLQSRSEELNKDIVSAIQYRDKGIDGWIKEGIEEFRGEIERRIEDEEKSKEE